MAKPLDCEMKALEELELRKMEGIKYRSQFALSLEAIVSPALQQQYHPYKV
jgi:hypothetical protein